MPNPEDLPTQCVEVHVTHIDQLFNAIDPSPFHSRDLDADADDYIVKYAKELPKNAALELLIHLDQPPGNLAKLGLVEQAIRAHFEASAQSTQAQLKDLFKRGRTSLLIGLAFLSASIGVSQWLGSDSGAGLHAMQILQQSIVIGGWVAMWRPMEIFLYDWWPVAARIRLLRRLSRLKVTVRMGNADQKTV
jgi:hypothetical protein